MNTLFAFPILAALTLITPSAQAAMRARCQALLPF